MSWVNSITLTMRENGVLSTLSAVQTGGRRAGQAVGSIVGEAARAGQALKSSLSAGADILFKLPSQVQAIQGILSGLSMPSKLAGSLETTRVAFRVLIGDAQLADATLSRIQALAASTPFEFPELADSARMLAAFGEEADSIPETLRRIGDIAAGTGTAIGELAEIYGKARVAGTLFSEDINQLTGRGIPVLQQFAAQLGVGVDQVKKLAAEGKITFPMLETAFKNLTGEGGQFSGMMEQIAGTFEGKLSTLADSFKGLLAAMGAGVNEGLKPIFDELTTALDGQQSLAQSIGEDLGYGLEVALEAVKDGSAGEILAASFDVAVNRLRDGFENAVNWLIDNFPPIWNPAEMGRRLGQRMAENAMRPVGVTEKYDAVSGSTREAEERLQDALRKPRRTVDEKRQQRKDAAENEEALKKFEKEAGEVVKGAQEKAKEREGFRKQAESDFYNLYEAPGVPIEGRGGKENKSGKALMDKLFPSEQAAAPTARTDRRQQAGETAAGVAESMREDAAGDGARRRIRGAVLPGSFQYENGRKVMRYPDRADSMAGAGNAAAQQRQRQEAQASATAKAIQLFINRFPELVEASEKTARNTAA